MFHIGTISTLPSIRVSFMAAEKGNILIIDDDREVLLSARMVLRKEYSKADIMESPDKLEAVLRDGHYDVILLDMNFVPGETGGEEGIRWLRRILSIDEDINVVMMTAYGDINLAVEAMKFGAVDFIVKPWDNSKLLATVHTAFELSRSRKEIRKLRSREFLLAETINREYENIIGKSPAMQSVFETIGKVADTDANVLILGENGTGKELVARAIHRSSSRKNESFMPVDMAAIPEPLFESELFGHVRGAFTGAGEDRAGRFELASGGTLFLDEIGNVATSLQSKLLNVLQNKQVYRVGSAFPADIDIRLICATNADLARKVSEGEFREDLLYRINTVEVRIPPLRDRVADIPDLVNHYVPFYAGKYGKRGIRAGKGAMDKLMRYRWPGNVRELQHLVERAVIMCLTDTLGPDDFPLQRALENNLPLKGKYDLESLEKQAIIAAIGRNGGNLSVVAKELGLGRTTLYRKIEKYGINNKPS